MEVLKKKLPKKLNNSGVKTKKLKKKKHTKHIGKLYINIKSNNIIFTATNKKNNVLFVVSSGMAGFKKAKRSSLYAVEVTTEYVIKKISQFNLGKFFLYLKGANRKKRRTCILLLKKAKLFFFKIKDITPIAHGGCRKKKSRRL